jgi:hypothetical protein
MGMAYAMVAVALYSPSIDDYKSYQVPVERDRITRFVTHYDEYKRQDWVEIVYPTCLRYSFPIASIRTHKTPFYRAMGNANQEERKI